MLSEALAQMEQMQTELEQMEKVQAGQMRWLGWRVAEALG